MEDGPEDDESDESVGDDASDESVGEDEVPTCSTNPVFRCSTNPVFEAIYEDDQIKPKFTSTTPNEAVQKRIRKSLIRTISCAYHGTHNINPTNPLHIQTESGYVSPVHDHEDYDGAGLPEDIERTKREIAQRKRVAYQMRGLHIRLVHKKVSLCDICLVLRIDKTSFISFYWGIHHPTDPSIRVGKAQVYWKT